MAGHDTPPLNDEQLRAALDNPFGSKTLKELARGKAQKAHNAQVAILFDDLTRPAPTWRIVPFVLETLHDAGIKEEQIRFVAAYANHAAMCREDFAKSSEKMLSRDTTYTTITHTSIWWILGKPAAAHRF